MKHRLRKCKRCDLYTMQDKCPICDYPTTSAHPAPFSPDDRFLEYKIKSILRKG